MAATFGAQGKPQAGGWQGLVCKVFGLDLVCCDPYSKAGETPKSLASKVLGADELPMMVMNLKAVEMSATREVLEAEGPRTPPLDPEMLVSPRRRHRRRHMNPIPLDLLEPDVCVPWSPSPDSKVQRRHRRSKHRHMSSERRDALHRASLVPRSPRYGGSSPESSPRSPMAGPRSFAEQGLAVLAGSGLMKPSTPSGQPPCTPARQGGFFRKAWADRENTI